MAAAHLRAPAVQTVSAPYAPGCTGKLAFASQADASRTARKANTRHRPYQCLHCRLWHNTTQGKAP